MSPGESNREVACRLAHKLAVALLLAIPLTGCRLLRDTAQMPVDAMHAVVPGQKAVVVDPAALQVELQRFADGYTSRTAAALDEYARLVGTPEARSQALSWKVSVASAALGFASGPNPRVNLLDFMALTMLTRMALEEVWVKTTNGPAFQPWLDASRTLESDAWKLADGVLKPEQQAELRQSIQSWWVANPGIHTGFFARPEEFSSLIRQSGEAAEKSNRSGSVFSLVGLDPTAGLDPAVREVTRTRLFAERALFVAQRMVFLARWQTELFMDQFLRQEQVASALRSADRFSQAADSASQTAAQLPDRITAERQAILTALDEQEGKLRELSAEVSRTLAAGEKMSGSFNTTITTFDALMKRFGVGEPSTMPSSDTNSVPFRILDYAHTADRLAVMAKELDELIKDAGTTVDSPALTRRIQELRDATERAGAEAKSVLNHAFLLGAGLVLLTFGCALAWRRLAPLDSGVR